MSDDWVLITLAVGVLIIEMTLFRPNYSYNDLNLAES